MPARTSSPPPPAITPEEIDDILYFARTDSLTDLTETLDHIAKTTKTTGTAVAAAAVDPDTGNTCLHYAAANGHTQTIGHLTTTLRLQHTSLLTRANASGNTPLHYAALNGHLEAVKLLLGAFGDEKVLLSRYVSQKNVAGYDAAFEAESNDKDAVVQYLLGVMDEADEGNAGEDVAVGAGNEGRGGEREEAEVETEMETEMDTETGQDENVEPDANTISRNPEVDGGLSLDHLKLDEKRKPSDQGVDKG